MTTPWRFCPSCGAPLSPYMKCINPACEAGIWIPTHGPSFQQPAQPWPSAMQTSLGQAQVPSQVQHAGPYPPQGSYVGFAGQQPQQAATIWAQPQPAVAPLMQPQLYGAIQPQPVLAPCNPPQLQTQVYGASGQPMYGITPQKYGSNQTIHHLNGQPFAFGQQVQTNSTPLVIPTAFPAGFQGGLPPPAMIAPQPQASSPTDTSPSTPARKNVQDDESVATSSAKDSTSDDSASEDNREEELQDSVNSRRRIRRKNWRTEDKVYRDRRGEYSLRLRRTFGATCSTCGLLGHTAEQHGQYNVHRPPTRQALDNFARTKKRLATSSGD